MRPAFDILIDLYPTLPEVFTRAQVVSSWPKDEMIKPASMSANIKRAVRAGMFKPIERQGNHIVYRKAKQRPIYQTPGQKDWATFKENPKKYLESL